MSFSRIRSSTTNFLTVSCGKLKESGLLWVLLMLTLAQTLLPKVVRKMRVLMIKPSRWLTLSTHSGSRSVECYCDYCIHDDSTMVFAYYKEGATNPTFLYFGHGLKEVKC